VLHYVPLHHADVEVLLSVQASLGQDRGLNAGVTIAGSTYITTVFIPGTLFPLIFGVTNKEFANILDSGY